MGWFWGSNSNDPVKQIDPSLREYLENEAPKKYVPTSQSPSPAVEKEAQPASSEAVESSTPSAPSASLFPDGRYAHLWKTYKPPVEKEASEVKGAERVIEMYKQRGDTVHRAAMENCALEHEALTLCFQTGTWAKRLQSRLTSCSEENGKFSRCFTTQAKFLQALGYASSFEWNEEREERIQMHADKLYHEMLDYENQVEEARAAGREPPALISLFNPQARPLQPTGNAATELEIPGGEAIPAGFRPSKSLDRLTPHERELEIRAHNAQLEQQKLYVEEASPFMKSQEDARSKRREKAVSWFGEAIGKWVT
ncbi:hypothetical protein P175DRAFT_0493111 [Aspergillus ochraceoroseus IBT 24754]|uniref:Autophagy protein n=3 Tax=Aspergillus subgen. Nidulantes TaxID=2720870 RepID=A0A0F8UDN3_9EURO|nr:uncharacterized protein P175DRAFT_0493111 [Aspergillus ochraceoroseus IBT 24754]KKK17859.1 hypothetical protein ARAM_007383 [Aspergillus rambellii]KKK23047.1 hypothetical protein AOCH_006822 [Aspergillus ochraceoroseus]PTU20786.1 hypothetical protein P175DRAFT_0493111 [Aspergillus ochraceoroseus IBT 24754]